MKTITVPLAEDHKIVRESFHKMLEPRKKRILAIDDQASNTRLVKLYLEQTDDYVVREENDPKAAISTAEEFEPHLGGVNK